MTESKVVWDEIQQEAIDGCCDITNRFFSVSGPAGTGKTGLMKEIYNNFIASGYRVVLCAPTGKAAKRIQEATGIDAMTIHRLLEYSSPWAIDYATGEPMGVSVPKKGKKNKLAFDVILVDEYSMVTQDVHRSLMDAIPSGGLLRVFGDTNQLKPIEENKRLQELPSIFEKLLKDFKSVILTKIYRQDEGSGIVQSGSRILQGKIPEQSADFNRIFTEKPVEVLKHQLLKFFDEGVNYSHINNQVICLGHLTWVGSRKLNLVIQNIFQSGNKEAIVVPRHKWVKEIKFLKLFVGDKVIQTTNDYNLCVYNGEIGIIIEINQDMSSIIVDFGDRLVEYPALMEIPGRKGTMFIDPRMDLDLAYAVTTHKMQGSECQHAIYIMNKSNFYMQNRSNFYTGITRARKHVTVITDMVSLTRSVRSIK